MNVALVLVVFVAAAVGDVFWTRYMLFVTAHRAVMASLFAALIFGIGAISIDSYVHNIWYLVPAAFGGATGTYISVRTHK